MVWNNGVMPTCIKHIKPFADPILTLIYWSYFTLGYIIFFSPFYVGTALFCKNRERTFQRLNHIFYKGFFFLVRKLTPGLSIHIQDQVLSIRSSVIISNHISYLDPILLISLFEMQKTIVKSVFFGLPIFGWVIKNSGYLPSETGNDLNTLMIEQIEGMKDYLDSGGNLFVFPEGTRSRDGRIGRLNKGAFKIAKRCHAPISVLFIQNTDRLFRPEKFLFNTCIPNTIKIELIGKIIPDDQRPSAGISHLMTKVLDMMEARLNTITPCPNRQHDKSIDSIEENL
jgi:1-acyl-sn-glycerol-3-phosphate acyltransferase